MSPGSRLSEAGAGCQGRYAPLRGRLRRAWTPDPDLRDGCRSGNGGGAVRRAHAGQRWARSGAVAGYGAAGGNGRGTFCIVEDEPGPAYDDGWQFVGHLTWHDPSGATTVPPPICPLWLVSRQQTAPSASNG